MRDRPPVNVPAMYCTAVMPTCYRQSRNTCRPTTLINYFHLPTVLLSFFVVDDIGRPSNFQFISNLSCAINPSDHILSFIVCGRPDKPHYRSCTSVRPSVRPVGLKVLNSKNKKAYQNWSERSPLHKLMQFSHILSPY